jgi:hypothetical protein
MKNRKYLAYALYAKIYLNEGCLFKCELNDAPAHDQLTLTVELLFLDAELANEKRRILKPIFTQEVLITDTHQFSHGFLPINFQNNFCIASTLVHSLPLCISMSSFHILEYKFQPTNEKEQFESFLYNVTSGCIY